MRRWIVLACLGGILLSLAGCNMPSPATPTVGGIEFIRTSAARTLDAVSTTMAGQQGTPIPNASQAVPTKVLLTPLPGSTQSPAKSPTPGTATVSGTPQPCDQAGFIRDVNIPDGTLLLPGTVFTKIWELKNTGSCAWNSMYSLVFANEGDLMGGSISKPLIPIGAVQPGESIQVSMVLTAPTAPGDFKSNWRLRNPSGVDFSPGGKPFWVTIKVAQKFAMIDDLCFATWNNGNSDQPLPCPGKPGDPRGSVSRVNEPKFSTGYQDNEPAIQLEPELKNDGSIVGIFPPIQLDATNTQYCTIIACAYDSKACDTRVTITAQTGSDPERTLGDWNIKYSQDWIIARVDLAPFGMAGKPVVLRYTVRANGPANQDRVLFLSPIFAKP